MRNVLLLLVMSVFLGTEFLAIPTPAFQLSLYRVMVLAMIPILAYLLRQGNSPVIFNRHKYAHIIIGVFIFWLFWGAISILWAIDLISWIRGLFLLTVGILAIIAIFMGTRTMDDWQILVKGVWVMMTLLLLLGFSELLTNHYLFADVGKLDRYGTFASQPLTRMPVTIFENQNDYATMLLAYLAVNSILYTRTRHVLFKGIVILASLGAGFQIYMTDSRLSLLMLVVFFAVIFVLRFKIDLRKPHIYTLIGLGVLGICALAIIQPGFLGKFDQLLIIDKTERISGDIARVNMIRLGLGFSAQTFGIGIGAGQSQYWLENFAQLPLNYVFNLHNWWLEVLVNYGIFVFIAYISAYIMSIYRLFQLRKVEDKQFLGTTNALIAFMLIFIAASLTSANNMLIEWHWVFFGLIFAYINIMEDRFILKGDKA